MVEGCVSTKEGTSGGVGAGAGVPAASKAPGVGGAGIGAGAATGAASRSVVAGVSVPIVCLFSKLHDTSPVIKTINPVKIRIISSLPRLLDL